MTCHFFGWRTYHQPLTSNAVTTVSSLFIWVVSNGSRGNFKFGNTSPCLVGKKSISTGLLLLYFSPAFSNEKMPLCGAFRCVMMGNHWAVSLRCEMRHMWAGNDNFSHNETVVLLVGELRRSILLFLTSKLKPILYFRDTQSINQSDKKYFWLHTAGRTKSTVGRTGVNCPRALRGQLFIRQIDIKSQGNFFSRRLGTFGKIALQHAGQQCFLLCTSVTVDTLTRSGMVRYRYSDSDQKDYFTRIKSASEVVCPDTSHPDTFLTSVTTRQTSQLQPFSFLVLPFEATRTTFTCCLLHRFTVCGLHSF